jgi:Ca-activated chloride channel family protein
MTFAWPHLLWLLLVPAGFLAWELTHRRRTAGRSRPKILRAEAGSHSLTLAPSTAVATGTRTRIRYWLFAGLTLAALALARPQYGRLEEPVFDQSREILIAVDLSRSMLAPDVKPSRLERSKLLIQSLLEKLEGERVGLVVFAGTSFLQSPLSSDYEILREFLPALGPDFLPQGGSNYGALLDASIQAFGSSNAADRFLVILSDGEATDDNWKSKIEELKKKNIRVLGLGVGTAAGAMIPDGSGSFAKDERGAVVLTRLESGTLQELASATGGVYRDASGWLDLAGLVKETVDAGQKGDFLEKNTIRLAERFQWPLAFGVWCLLVSFYMEFPVRPRPRAIKLSSRSAPPSLPAASTPAQGVAATVSLLALVLWFTPSRAQAADDTGPVLGKIYARLATQDSLSPTDYAEIARETLRWGQRLVENGSPVVPGPVHDAIEAVDRLIKRDAKVADWGKLRSDLEELLKKIEEQKKEQEKQDQKDKKDQENQQNQDQQDQDQKNQDKKKDGSKQKQDSKDQKKDGQQGEKPDQSDQQDQGKPDDQQKQGDSAFGPMDKKDQPPKPPQSQPQPDNDTQKAGGNDKPLEQGDPVLAVPLQKLEQLRNQDSPARLFQFMDGDKKPAVKTKGKDW